MGSSAGTLTEDVPGREPPCGRLALNLFVRRVASSRKLGLGTCLAGDGGGRWEVDSLHESINSLGYVSRWRLTASRLAAQQQQRWLIAQGLPSKAVLGDLHPAQI